MYTLRQTWYHSGFGSLFRLKMSYYEYGISHCGNKTLLRPFHFPNGISYTEAHGIIILKQSHVSLQYIEHKQWMMAGITWQGKTVFGILLLCFTYFKFTPAAFPWERDMSELVGGSQQKHWIVFMNKIVSMCFNKLKAKPSSLINVLRCLCKPHIYKCVATRYLSCVLLHKYPNILVYMYRFSPGHIDHFQHSIRISLHLHFSLNITVVHSNILLVGQRNHGIAGFTIAGKRHYGLQYPKTFMNPNNTIEVKFDMEPKNFVVIEYSVAQNLNVIDLPLMTVESTYYLWGYFLVRAFNVLVDIRARLAIDVISCVFCELIVYDGFNERLPIIMKINDTRISEKVVASTFQVFVSVAENLNQQNMVLRYAPVYINTAVYNLTNDEHYEISFDNNTSCSGHSLSARLCVYTFYTSTLRKINFSLTDVQFTGSYHGTNLTAGIALFNQGQGTTAKIFEVSHDLPALELTDLEIISTASTMHVAVFVYYVFASLTLQFSMSTTNCNVFLVSNDYISYSGYVTPLDDTQRVFKIHPHSPDHPAYMECFQLQFIPSLHALEFRLPHAIPVLLTIYKAILSPFFVVGCHINFQRQIRAYVSKRIYYRSTSIETKIHVISSFIVERCKPTHYYKIRFQQLPCKLPCQCLTTAKHSEILWHENDNITCDICNHVYTGGMTNLKYNISFAIGIKSRKCSSMQLKFMDLETYPYGLSFMTLSIKRDNITITIPDFTGVIDTYIATKTCLPEIPIVALNLASGHSTPQKRVTEQMLKDVVWRGVVYIPYVSRFSPVTWETAAQSCMKAGLTLLTIHNQAEYQFLKGAFLQTHDMLILYVGLKRQVICLCFLHITLTSEFSIWLNIKTNATTRWFTWYKINQW